MGSAAVRAAAEPGGRLPLPDGAVLLAGQARCAGAVGDPAAVDRRRRRGGLPGHGTARRPAGHRDAVDPRRRRLRLCRVPGRAARDRCPVERVPPGRDAALDSPPACGCRPWRPARDRRGPVGRRGRAVRRGQRDRDHRGADPRGPLRPDPGTASAPVADPRLVVPGSGGGHPLVVGPAGAAVALRGLMAPVYRERRHYHVGDRAVADPARGRELGQLPGGVWARMVAAGLPAGHRTGADLAVRAGGRPRPGRPDAAPAAGAAVPGLPSPHRRGHHRGRTCEQAGEPVRRPGGPTDQRPRGAVPQPAQVRSAGSPAGRAGACPSAGERASAAAAGRAGHGGRTRHRRPGAARLHRRDRPGRCLQPDPAVLGERGELAEPARRAPGRAGRPRRAVRPVPLGQPAR